MKRRNLYKDIVIGAAVIFLMVFCSNLWKNYQTLRPDRDRHSQNKTQNDTYQKKALYPIFPTQFSASLFSASHTSCILPPSIS